MTHVPEPDRETEVRDQREFDQAVERNGKIVLEVLAAVGIVAALTMSAVALSQSGGGQQTIASATVARQVVAAPVASTAPAAPAAATVADLKIIPSYKVGPDGKKHDAFTQTEFAVKAGQPLTLKIDNTDNAAHSITSPVAGVNITIQPGVHTYKLVVAKAGRYSWLCLVPCDSDANGWAMQNPGYMSGYINVT